MSITTLHLGDICNVSTGQSAPQEADAFGAEGHPFVRAGSLETLVAGSSENSLEKISLTNAQRYRLKLFPAGTIVFAKSGMSAKLGRVHMLTQPCYVVSHLATIEPGRVNGRFLFHWFVKNSPSELIANDAYPSIRTSEIKALEIRLPLIEEQKRIAVILDKAGGLLRKRQQAIRLADDFLRAVFLDLFGDLQANPKKWDSVPLGELIQEGPTNGLYCPSDMYGSGTPILRIDGFYDGRLLPDYEFKRVRIDEKTQKRYDLRKNSIVVNRVNSREFVGKAAYVGKLGEPTVFESNMMNLTLDPERVDHVFIVEQMRLPYIRAQIATARKDAVNQSSVNQDDIRNLTVRLPPIDRQAAFRKAYEKHGELQKLFKPSSLETDAAIKALQASYLT